MKHRQTLLLLGIAAALLLAGVLGCWMVLHQRQPHPIAEIYQNGVCRYRIDLADVTAPYTITLTGEDDAENVIRVSPGAIAMESANCPDGLCVDQGAISDGTLPIVCLPHQVYITITSDQEGSYDVQVH